jgi:serine/threonine-protein kinase
VAGYVLEEQVGEGGMAVVFRARDERLGRVVALKVLAPGLAADAEFRRRFLRESRAAAAVDDPHIIPVFEAGEAGGVLFLAMRYVPSSDVCALLRRQGRLPAGRAAAIISAVASALDAAHAAGLVHRDVKPANMLLDSRAGRPDHVYLSDFGLSKPLAAATGLTRTGQLLGTLDYIAPEQLEGGEVDGRADQYALACSAFELLAGAPPFQREQPMAVMYAHVSEPPPLLASWRPDLPPTVGQVLARALAKAPSDRYASCREFADALRASLRLPPYAEVGQVSDIDPGYRDVAVRLENPREQQQVAALCAEARRLYDARQWAAVVKVGDRLRALNPDAADLDYLMTSARTELAAAERAEQMAEDYRAALRTLDAGAWQQAADALEGIAQVNPGYRDTSALLARARSLVNEPKQPQRKAHGIIGQPKVVQIFRHHYVAVNQYAPVSSVAFSADRRWLASSARDGSVQIWDTTTGQQHLRVMAYAWAVIFSTDGRWLVTGGKRTAEIWDTTTGQQRLSVKHKSSRDHALALTRDGRLLATGSPGSAVRIWDTADGQKLTTISLSQQISAFAVPCGVDGLAFSPDGRWLATASTDKTARIWDAATGHPVLKVAHGGAVLAVAFSPDGRWLATASTDKTARIWDTATGKALAELPHKKAVGNVVFNPDGDRLATASQQSAQIWAL